MPEQVFTGEQKITISPSTGFEELYYKIGDSRLEAKNELSGDTYTVTLKDPIAVTKDRVGTKNRVELHIKPYGAKEEVRYLGDFAFSPSIAAISPTVAEISDMNAYYPSFKLKVIPDVGAFTGDILLSLDGKTALNLTQNYGASMQKVAAESTSEYGIYQLSTTSPLRNTELGLHIEASSTVNEKYTLGHSALYNTVDIIQTSSWSKIAVYIENASITVSGLTNVIPSFKVGFRANKGVPSKIRYRFSGQTVWHDMPFTYASIPEESGSGYVYNYKVTASSAIPKSLLTSEGGLVDGTSGSATIMFQISNSMSPTEWFTQECQYSVQYDAAKIYGVEWDWYNGNSSRGVRTDAAVGFKDPVPALNSGTGSSPFDTLMPWAGMIKTSYSSHSVVKEPKYWFKWTKTSRKMKLQIADGPVEGFHVDPVTMDHGDGMGELDFAYIGRYHCSNYYNSTDSWPKTGMTRKEAREEIYYKGTTRIECQIDYAQFWYVGMLMLVEFADWDVQACVGIGGVGTRNGSDSTYEAACNGETDSMKYHTGTTAASRDKNGFIQYRNIENWWGNLKEYLDGCYYSEGYRLNIILDPSKFSDDSNGVDVGRCASGVADYPYAFFVPDIDGFEWALGASSKTDDGGPGMYTTDGWMSSDGSSYSCIEHGSYFGANWGGPFYVSYAHKYTVDYPTTGCRMQIRPKKVA